MPKFGFLIDNRKCIGCHACTVACKSEHQVPIGVDRTWVKYIEKGAFPNNRRMFTVMRCNHCEDAPCVTICPVTSLYKRDDGIVDFDSDRCIGCKACIQACPYDALFIDPDNDTAAKCNFCTHRLDVGLEPSCVAVCPVRAIVAGDLDDPASEISTLVDRHPVQVRKPEKGTKPQLFYIEGDEAALVPNRTEADGQYMWSGGQAGTNGPQPDQSPDRTVHLPVVKTPTPSPRRVYDVRPRPPAWGWEVVAYTWAKSIAAGAFLAILAARLFTQTDGSTTIPLTLGGVALVFLAVTAVLLVADLKQPRRFLYVLLRPHWTSWLVRGAYVLTGYGLVLTLWMIAMITGLTAAADVLFGIGVVLAVLSAVYTAFLFAQAKGRDFWQNPLLSVHLIAHALVAGGAVWLLIDLATGSWAAAAPRVFLAAAIGFSLLVIGLELATTPATQDAHRAMRMIVGKPLGGWFWAAGIGAGHVLPLILLVTWLGGAGSPGAGLPGAGAIAAILSLAGLFVIERLWVLAPQRIALS